MLVQVLQSSDPYPVSAAFGFHSRCVRLFVHTLYEIVLISKRRKGSRYRKPLYNCASETDASITFLVGVHLLCSSRTLRLSCRARELLNRAPPDYILPPGKWSSMLGSCLARLPSRPSFGCVCPLRAIRSLTYLTIPVLISPPPPSLGCEFPKRVFSSIEALLDVARPDLFPPTPNTRLPSTTLGVAEASIYTCVYYWFFFGLLCNTLFGRCMCITAHFYN